MALGATKLVVHSLWFFKSEQVLSWLYPLHVLHLTEVEKFLKARFGLNVSTMVNSDVSSWLFSSHGPIGVSTDPN